MLQNMIRHLSNQSDKTNKKNRKQESHPLFPVYMILKIYGQPRREAMYAFISGTAFFAS